VFPFTNKILNEDDLTVYSDDVLKTIGTDYTVSGVGVATGGNVTFVAAQSTGTSVLITKDGVEFTQDTDYVENDAFPAAAHEDALDKLTNIAQKIWDSVRRSVKLAITSSLTDLEMPDPEATTVIGWNGSADGLLNYTLTSGGAGAISDEAYASTAWDGVTTVAPSKNAMRDKILAMISDDAYASTAWDGVSTVAPSKNDMRDQVLAMISDSAYNSTTWDSVSTVAPSKNAVRDYFESLQSIVQVVSTQTGEVSTGTSIIPNDDSPPLITEGDEVMSRAITPVDARDKLLIDIVCMVSSARANSRLAVSLCQGTISTSLAAMAESPATATAGKGISFRHSMTAGTDSSTTFFVRVGDSAASTTTFNGDTGSRRFGGKMASSITITEIKP